MTKRLFALSLAVLGAVAAIVATTAGAGRKADQLVGAGSSFVSPLVAQWQKDYPSKTGVDIVYSPIGSGGGIAAISARTVDFGASDAPLSPDQLAGCKGCYQIPWALGGTAIMINVKTNARAPLKITGPVLGLIYLGSIKRWNAPAIQKLNPKVTLPDEPIVPVYRSDASGTSYNFTDYLSSVSPYWKAKAGAASTQPPFPTGVGAKGSSGVAGVVKKTDGAIGYADIAFAITNHIPVMAVKNAAGKFTTPGIASIGAAATAYPKVPSSNEMHIVNPPKRYPKAYPISTYTYVIVPIVTSKAAMLKRFIFYALTQGQKLGIPLRFVPIPKQVLVASEKTLKKVKSS
ncbi:MAG: phosphate ABC transporter substrate-binding protein PstS [Candidatus Rokuibacteriota bacterium]|nr:MAG: phosphate ABC transporter substrate-binding protein PstS [Candidatus Rokubacteria bacterium]